MYGNSGSGIRFNGNLTGGTISGNLTFANRDHGISISGDDGSSDVASGFVITNNIVVDNAMFGINVHHDANDPGNEYGHNLIHGNGKGVFGLDNSTDKGTWTPSKASGVRTGDPGLINYRDDGSGDYHLTASSRCVDAGTATGAPATDFEGTARPQGAAYDIGPYEYGSSLPGPGLFSSAAARSCRVAPRGCGTAHTAGTGQVACQSFWRWTAMAATRDKERDGASGDRGSTRRPPPHGQRRAVASRAQPQARGSDASQGPRGRPAISLKRWEPGEDPSRTSAARTTAAAV